MLSFKSFLTEAKQSQAGGIPHLTHLADTSFHGKEGAEKAANTLKGVVSGDTPITRKIDDKMSFHAIRKPSGEVGVKYKGSGSHYDFSESEVEKQHGEKPYKAGPLKALVTHLGKVLPKKPGEYQGGFMSTPETREEKGGKIGHTPNAITYSTHANSAEGQKLKNSKLSVTVHTKLSGANKTPSPITDMKGFKSHPDVHLVNHIVTGEERKLGKEDKTAINHHIESAQKLMKDHDYSHHEGHHDTMEGYINSTVRSGKAPSVEGYKAHLEGVHNKKIESVKTDKAKSAKTQVKNSALQHVETNKEKFSKSFQIHQHLQKATDRLADALDSNSKTSGFGTSISGKESGGEGYVANGVKIVNRPKISQNLLARSDVLKGKK